MNTGVFDIYRIMFLSALLCAACVLASKTYAAAIFADSSCDEAYYESLEARATLEAQREITQNQNLIFKPDSVLEYTCFDSHLSQLALATQSVPLFSEDPNWGGPAGNMPNALAPVGASHLAYLTANFNHTPLGGRMTTNFPPSGNVARAAYACNVMDAVWLEAKCMDFIHQASHDGFFTFEEYEANEDMRTLPTACTKTFQFQQQLDTALDPDTTPWNEDDVFTYFYLFDRGPNDCGNALNPRRSRVRTGLVINRTSGSASEYNEFVCLIPGCYYDPGSNQCRPASDLY